MLSLPAGQLFKSAHGLPKNISRSLRTQVVLGSPSAGCRDVGVCRVLPADLSLIVKCPVVYSWMSITEEGKLRVAFECGMLGPSEFNKHFRWSLFQVLEPCDMPLFVRRFFKVQKLTLLAGVYQVYQKSNRLIVDFQITLE